MKISELKDKGKNINMDLVIIWDKSQPEEKFGRTIKSVIVKDAGSEKGDESPSAYLDLYDKDAETYKMGDKIRIIDAYSKLIQGKNQFRVTNVLRVEKLNSGPSSPEKKVEIEVDTIKENSILSDWITRNYGERCKDYDKTCHCCKAWDYYAKLKYDEE